MKIMTKIILSSMGYCDTICLFVWFYFCFLLLLFFWFLFCFGFLFLWFFLKIEYTSNYQNSNRIKLYPKEVHNNGTCIIMKRPKPDQVDAIFTRGLKLQMKENIDSRVHYYTCITETIRGEMNFILSRFCKRVK